MVASHTAYRRGEGRRLRQSRCKPRKQALVARLELPLATRSLQGERPKSALSVLLVGREPDEAKATLLQIAKAMGLGDDQADALLVRSANARPNPVAAAG